MTGRALVIRGDAAHIPMPDASVDLIVTSPPYYALRSYTDGGVHYPGQIGSEATPAEYIAALIDCTREWARVLKPGGSMFVDLGDKYNSAASGQNGTGATTLDPARGPKMYRAQRGGVTAGVRPKSLLLLPERYRIAAVDRLGLIARAVIVWAKPNGLPESVTDRVRRSHEDWVHLVKAPRYYSAVDEIREPQSGTHPRRADATLSAKNATGLANGVRNGYFGDTTFNPLGKLPGSVWTVPTEPLTVPPELGVDHFAAFPTEWPRRLILGWSPPGICTACGEGRRPVAAGGGYAPEALARRGTASQEYSYRTASGKPSPLLSVNLSGPEKERYRIPHTITGYVCACTPYTDHPGTGERHRNGDHPSGGNAGGNVNAGTRLGDLGSAVRVGPWREHHLDEWTPPPTRPAIVLDPFGGTGTTALVARALGRIGISVDMSGDYSRLAIWRTTNPGELAKAMRVEKPAPVDPDQLDLFEVTP